jgi:hypothetical protein
MTKSDAHSVLNDVNVRFMMPSEAMVHWQNLFPVLVSQCREDVSTDITPELVPLDGWHRHPEKLFAEHVTVAGRVPAFVGAGVVVRAGVVVVVRVGVVVAAVVVVAFRTSVSLSGTATMAKHSSHTRTPVSVSMRTSDGSPRVCWAYTETRHLEIEVTAARPRSSGTNAASVAFVVLIRSRSRKTSPENAPAIDDFPYSRGIPRHSLE